MHTLFPVRRLGILLLAFCLSSAQATPLMEVRADQLLFAANELKSTLALTPNQLTLWQQVSSKANAILRTRQQRREHLHMAAKEQLANPAVELRDVGNAINAEADLSASEDRQLRELWLSVTDALTDQQRAKVAAELLSILERVDAPERPQHGVGEGGAPPGGKRGKRPGGLGGGARGGGLD